MSCLCVGTGFGLYVGSADLACVIVQLFDSRANLGVSDNSLASYIATRCWLVLALLGYR